MNASKGFTLFEILVSIAIFTVVTSIVLFNYNTFQGTTVLQNLGYQTAIAVRQAQEYGVNVRSDLSQAGRTCAGVSCFSHAYGVHWGSIPSQGLSTFALFVDETDTFVYQNATEIAENFNVQHGYAIVNYCVVDASAHTHCASSTKAPPGAYIGDLGALDISFKRPDPTANIIPTCIGSGAGYNACTTGSPFTSATVYLQSSQTKQYLSVTVSGTGQISVGNISS
jgi:prepilin-type N-terminal cleavage/methylation domain-containing protein